MTALDLAFIVVWAFIGLHITIRYSTLKSTDWVDFVLFYASIVLAGFFIAANSGLDWSAS